MIDAVIVKPEEMRECAQGCRASSSHDSRLP